MAKKIPFVAIIGRPNVGKSTFLNRIIRKPVAITDDRPGVTRDRNAVEFEWNGRLFMLVDTGGYVVSGGTPMEQAVSEQSRLAIEESDVVIFLTDVKTGITDLDENVRDVLVKIGKPVVLAVNKIDSSRQETDIYEFYNLGLGEPFPVSAKTGRGTGELLDEIVNKLSSEEEFGIPDEEDVPRIAFIGRPNVGKSSIVNALIGEKRTIVSEIPGTTRDSTDTPYEINGRKLILVDTAGLKKTTRLTESLEYYSSIRTLHSLSRCDVAVAVIDIKEGLTSYDKSVIDDVEKAGKGLVIAANKWDLVEKDHTTLKKTETDIRDLIPDKYGYPIVFTSAVSGQRVRRLLEIAVEIYDRRRKRVQTSELNSFIERLILPPGSGDIRIYYATQYSVEPPAFAFFVNDIRRIRQNLVRFMKKTIIETFGFEGTPVKISFKKRTH